MGVWHAIMEGKQYKKKCSTVETYNRSNSTKLDRTLGVRDRKSGDWNINYKSVSCNNQNQRPRSDVANSNIYPLFPPTSEKIFACF